MQELTNKLSEYRATIIEERKIEKELDQFFQLLAIRDNPRYDRCSDYGERVIQIIIPFDEINMNLFTIKSIDVVKKKIVEYRELRNKQKKLENEIHQMESVQKILKQDVGAIGENIH